MIAPPDSTADTMLIALSTSIGGLNAAIEIDIDRTDEDRAFFVSERDTLQGHFDSVFDADREASSHALLVAQTMQARVQVGDTVLDRGVSKSKARMKVELKESTMPDGADHVFGSNVNEIVNAERAKEPGIVLKAVAKFPQVPSFSGKSEMAADLTVRAKQQQKAFAERDEANVKATALVSATRLAVKAGSDALYQLEKRLLDRFPRQTSYVKAFFYDVAPSKKKAQAPAAAPSTNE